MCLPLLAVAAIVAIAASAATASMSIVGQRAQQKAQIDYQSKLMDANANQMRQNRDLATKAYLDQASAANTQLAETREAMAANNFDQSRSAMQARGAAIASASEAGVYGVSLDNLLADFHRQEDMFHQRNEQNLLMKQQATRAQVSAYSNEALARTQQVQPYQPGPVAPVDYVGPALRVVQTAAGGYMNYSGAAASGAGTKSVDMDFNPLTAGK